MKKTLKHLHFHALLWLLILLTVFYAFPAAALVRGDAQTAEEETELPTSAEGMADAVEIPSLRSETAKHFRLSDGRYFAVEYQTPVHYLDENGIWQNIDNTLTEEGDGYTAATGVKFAKKTNGSGKIFTLQNGNAKLTVSLKDAVEKTPAQMKNSEKQYNGGFADLDAFSSSVCYTDILAGVDLEYILSSNRIKENIIVKERKENYRFVFDIQALHLTASMTEAGGILFTDAEGEILYHMPKGFAVDAVGEITGDVHYTLEAAGQNRYTVTVTVNSDWMNAAGRAYPVKIDPPLIENLTTQIDAYVDSYAPVGSFATDRLLMGSVEYEEGQHSTTKAFWRANFLPVLPDGAVVLSATLQMTLISAENYLAPGNAVSVYANRLNAAFFENVTWNTSPTSGTLLDYRTSLPSNGKLTLDLTKEVRGWYAGESNYGISLTAESGLNKMLALYSSRTDDVNNMPLLIVSYRSATGLDDLYSYSSVSDECGTAYINDLTGSMTYAVGTASAGAGYYMPTLLHRSPLAAKAYDMTEVSPAKYALFGNGWMWDFEEYLIPFTRYGADYYLWRTAGGSYLYFCKDSEGVFREESGLPYYLSAANGTVTLHNKNDGSYSVFGGYLRSLSKKVDKDGNELRINRTQNAVSSISYLPAGATEESSLYTLTAETNGYRIASALTGEDVALTLSNGKLTALQWYNGTVNTKSLYFTYNDDGKIISTYAGNTANRGLVFSWTEEGRVSGVSFSGGTAAPVGSSGADFTVSYEDGCTRYRTAGQNDYPGDSDDLLTTYIFDNYGRTVRSYTTDITGQNFYGIAEKTYKDNIGRKVSGEMASTVLPVNLLYNGGFEKSADFASSGWTDADGASSIQSRASFSNGSGRRYLAVNSLCEGANMDNTHGWYNALRKASQSVYLQAGTYTLSADTWCNDTDTSLAGFNGSAYLEVVFPGGTVQTSEKVNVAVTNSGTVSLTFAVETAGNYTVRLCADTLAWYDNFDTCFDNVILAKEGGSYAFSYVEDGDMEGTAAWQGGNRISGGVSGAFSRKVTGGILSSASVYQDVLSYPADSGVPAASVSYILTGWGKADSLKQTAEENTRPEAVFALAAIATYRNKTTGLTHTVEYKTPFAWQNKAWQAAEVIITLTEAMLGDANYAFPADTTLAEWEMIGLRVMGKYENNAGDACFDRFALVYDESRYTSYSYDGEKLSTVTLPDGKTVSYTYNDANATEYPSHVTAEDGSTYDFTYDTQKRMVSSTYASKQGTFRIRTLYTYDTFGNLTGTETFPLNSDGEAENLYQMAASALYSTAPDATFGLKLRETDAEGRVTRYLYDSDTGLLTALIYPDGTGVAYSYNAKRELVAVSHISAYNAQSGSYTQASVPAAEYTYNTDGTLSEVQTPTVSFVFSYDSYGNQTGVSVFDSPLITHTYGENNGKLQRSVYGNGFSVEYFYDALDRVVGIGYNQSGVVHRYTFTEDGKVASYTDGTIGQRTDYYYDSQGRPSKTHIVNTGTGRTLLDICYTYDAKGRLTCHRYDMGDDKFRVTNLEMKPQYNADGVMTSCAYSFTRRNTAVVFNASYTYDLFGRLSQKNAVLQNSAHMNQSYTYRQITIDGKNYTTGQFAEESLSVTNGTVSKYAKTYRYTYDSMGNLTGVDEVNGTAVTKLYGYSYDAKGQLSEERHYATSSLIRYTYSGTGDILTAKKYGMAEDGTATSLLSTRTWGYSDALTWNERIANGIVPYRGDTLVSYTTDNAMDDHATIEYDDFGIGNPTRYYNYATFTWSGRRLTGVTKRWETTPITYTYNDDGLRTSKTVNGETRYFLWENGRLVAEVIDGPSASEYKAIYYTYDAAGHPESMVYVDMTYDGYSETPVTLYYFTDVFGNVKALFDGSGNVVATYEYDAWGCLITGTSLPTGTDTVSTLARHNPLLYRGYYYDEETGFYYVKSRYYDPVICRWISPDGYVSTGQDMNSFNMFAYCGNNPVNRMDPSWKTSFSVPSAGIIGVSNVSSSTIGTGVPTSDVGLALPYIKIRPNQAPLINCYAYAVGLPLTGNPGMISGRHPENRYDVRDVFESVKADLTAKGYTVREISGPYAKVFDYEFKVAMRVGTQNAPFKDYNDYHFMRQTSTGQWAERHGSHDASQLWDIGKTPDTIPWEIEIRIDNLYFMYYYDSATIYFAIGR